VVSDGGFDGSDKLAQIVHDLTELGIAPEAITDFVRANAQTQHLNVSAQLQSGIRFMDFRIMYEHDSKDWYGLHCVQTNQKAFSYLQQIRQWMDEHPSELVVLWMSKHGSECKTGQDQYPDVSIDIKQAFWSKVEALFNGLLFDSSKSQLGVTPLAELIQSNQRMVIFAADYKEFSNSSQYAIDSCRIQNDLFGSVGDYNASSHKMIETFHQNGTLERHKQRKKNKFWLVSGAGTQGPALTPSAEMHFTPLTEKGKFKNRKACAAAIAVNGSATFCPESLLGYGQMTNYYRQRGIQSGIDPHCENCELPNAMYIDAVDHGGKIRTGLRLLSAPEGSPVCAQFSWTSCHLHAPSCDAGFTASGHSSGLGVVSTNGSTNGLCAIPFEKHFQCCRDQPEDQNTAGYPYVATFILANLRRTCKLRPKHDADCLRLTSEVQAMIDASPMHHWEDASVARHAQWPDSTN